MSGQRRKPVACLDCGEDTYKGTRCFVCFRVLRRGVRPSPPVASTAWIYCGCGATAPEPSDGWTRDGDAWRCAECSTDRAVGGTPDRLRSGPPPTNPPRPQQLRARFRRFFAGDGRFDG